MGKALIIGCGGVPSVAIHKCVQNSEVFEEICIASRTKSKCEELKAKLDGGKTKITTAQVDANNVLKAVLPDPFMEELNKWGLPWVEDFNPVLVDELPEESKEPELAR